MYVFNSYNQQVDLQTLSTSAETKSISFCSTCRNRLWQIQQTLPRNLQSIENDHEIVLVDYCSSDGLSEWVWNTLSGYIRDKKLVFFEVKNEVRWNVARAKNLAHRLAQGRYLFNLDADNFVTTSDLTFIKNAAESRLPCHQWSGVHSDGSFGRVGVPKELFRASGGYDETFLPMGHQDIDFINRLVAMGEKRLTLPAPEISAVQNTLSDKILETKLASVSYPDPVKAYEFMDWINDQISQFRLKTEGPVRLGGGFSYRGLLNGRPTTISGLDEIQCASESPD